MRGMRRPFLLSFSPFMDVLALTILVSTCLAGIFVVCFSAECRRRRRSSLERDSLLPLNDEPVAARAKTIHPR